MVDGSSAEARIVRALRARIDRAPPGERLPSTRALVAEHAAGPGTVQRALRVLAAQGLVESRPGVGTFTAAVAAPRPHDHGWQTAALRSPAWVPPLSTPMRTPDADVVALHGGYPDRALLPERLVRAALVRAARGEAALSRPPAAGLPELRAWFAAELGGVTPPGAADVIVLPGSQSGLGSVFRALVGAGRPLLIESPTYWGAILAAAQTGVHLVPLPSGPSGPDPDELDRAFRETGARAFYAQPTYANPTGAQWSAALADRVLDVVGTHGAFLVEDDWAHDLAVTSTAHPVAARDGSGHVVHLRSLTKSVSPSLRVAAVTARGPARDRILADRAAESLYVSGLLQAAALDVVTQPGWRTHLRRLRNLLRDRRDLLLACLREHAPHVDVAHTPAGGLHLWARLPDGVDVDRVARACEDAGVLVAAGTEWFPAEPTGPHLRLNYSGPDPGAFPHAARVVEAAIAAQLG